jgi:hypothetical protein
MKYVSWIGIIALSMAGAAQADTLWGVTNGTGDAGFWSGGEVFTVDTSNGNVSVKATYNNMKAFGDIALNSGGDVYVTYATDFGSGFNKLAKVDTSNWTFTWTQTLPEQVNALTFINGKLYGAAGGGSFDMLYRFDTLDGVTAPASVGPAGLLGSDGDLFHNPATGKTYNVYTPGSIGNLVELNTTTGAGTVIGTLNSTAQFGTTNGGQDYGWSGMEFDSNGKLWAGTFWDQNLYSRPDVLAGSNVALEYDLSADLGGTITGLSIPEPASLGLLAIGGLALLRRRSINV